MKTHLIIIAVVIVLVLVGLCVHTAAALDGSGTQEDPWRIQSLADFDQFAADPNYWAGFTRLETDVNLAGQTYTNAVIAPDNNNSDPYSFHNGPDFTGVFDGNDHKIICLTINDGGAGNDFLGLFGFIGGYGEVKNLGLEGGSVRGRYHIGGPVGDNDGSVLNCYSTGDVSGDHFVGGLLGENNGTITNCYSTGDVNGLWTVGGLVGYNEGTIANCYSTGSVSGNQDIGGLVGENHEGAISNCHSTGSVSGRGYYWNFGGLVGDNYYGSVSNCYSTGSVDGGCNSGGLVGGNNGTISSCHSTGSVSGAFHPVQIGGAGGLVGGNGYGTISNCYSTSNVTGCRVGGLVGLNLNNVTHCYSTGVGGGLVGGDYDWDSGASGTTTDSFWDIETSDCNTSAGGTGKTTAEMKTISTFTSAGWDFIEIWGIGEHQTYPYLLTGPAGDFNYDKEVNLIDLAILASHWLEEN